MAESTWEGKVLFRTDLHGGEIAIKPDQILIELDAEEVARANPDWSTEQAWAMRDATLAELAREASYATRDSTRAMAARLAAKAEERHRDSERSAVERAVEAAEVCCEKADGKADSTKRRVWVEDEEPTREDLVALYRRAVTNAGNRALARVQRSLGDGIDADVIEFDLVSHVRGDWWVFSTADEQPSDAVDVVVIAAALRERGIPAQPNHVYFLTSLAERHGKSLAPNTLAPNTLAPNTLAPNTLAPNTLAPNTLAASVLSQLGVLGAVRCCCPRGLSSNEERTVPRHAARPANGPGMAAAASDLGVASNVDVFAIDSTDFDDLIVDMPPYNNPLVVADLNGDEFADPAVCHGNFVCNIITRECGIATVLLGYADCMGAIDDCQLIDALEDADRRAQVDRLRILNLSLAGYTEDDRPSRPLAAQVKTMIDKGWVIVAAAGNNASCRIAFPAALPGVVAVASYGQHGASWFSNYGAWVDACAPGENVLAPFPDFGGKPDALKDLEVDKRSILLKDFNTGWATWSGTSFAAPFVTARLASALNAAKVRGAADAKKEALEEVLFADDLQTSYLYGTVVT